MPRATLYAAMVAGACREAGFEPDVRHRVTDLGTLARSGLAVALVPTLGRPEEDRELALRPLAGRSKRRSRFAAVRSAAHARPGLGVFLAELRARVSAA